MSIKIPITEKMLLEWLMNTDYNGKPFSDKLMAFIDEYNQLEDELKKAIGRFNKPDSKVQELEKQLNAIGISPSNDQIDDPDNIEFWISPKTSEKCKSNPRIERQVDELISRYKSAIKSNWEKFADSVEPYAVAFNEFHNAHIRELNFINRKLYGDGATMIKKNLPVTKIPDEILLMKW